MALFPGEANLQLDVLQPESCDDCGRCCEGVGSPVLLYATPARDVEPHAFRPPGLPQALIAEIDAHFGGVARGYEPQESCLWFDPVTRRCRHYEWRPQVCQDYEFGGQDCIERRRPFVKPTRSA